MSLFTELRAWFHADVADALVAFEQEVHARLDAIEAKLGIAPPVAPAAPATQAPEAVPSAEPPKEAS